MGWLPGWQQSCCSLRLVAAGSMVEPVITAASLLLQDELSAAPASAAAVDWGKTADTQFVGEV
jgi:transketolase C-terminal domain/subunit